MRVVFMGTPAVAVAALDELYRSHHHVAAVVTQPDKQRGRGRSVSASPVKAFAEEHSIPVLQPVTPKQPAFADELASHRPQALAVVAYGHILPVAVLDVAPAMNAHFSLLPRYRGAAPVQRAIMDGARETGVSVFMLEPTVDTGPVVAIERTEIGEEETAGELLARLAPIGARLRALDDLEGGTLKPHVQEDIDASPAPKIQPEEAEIDWALSARRIVDHVRALNPRPGAFTTFGRKRLIVWRARPVELSGAQGTILEAGDSLVVGAGDGGVALLEVQLEGKRPMPAGAFLRGHRLEAGGSLAGR